VGVGDYHSWFEVFMTGKQEIISASFPIVSYDPAQAGGDLSAVLVIERQNVVIIEDFSKPINFARYRVIFAADLRNLEYQVQVVKLFEIVKQADFAFQKKPIVMVDITGNEGLDFLVKSVLPDAHLCKFSGGMIRPRGHAGKFRTINKEYWVSRLALYLENGQIIVDSQLPQSKEIRKEFESFSGTVRQTGTVQYSAHGSGKDDYISCALLALTAEPGYSIIPGY
jgi:hypothetical protein